MQRADAGHQTPAGRPIRAPHGGDLHMCLAVFPACAALDSALREISYMYTSAGWPGGCSSAYEMSCVDVRTSSSRVCARSAFWTAASSTAWRRAALCRRPRCRCPGTPGCTCPSASSPAARAGRATARPSRLPGGHPAPATLRAEVAGIVVVWTCGSQAYSAGYALPLPGVVGARLLLVRPRMLCLSVRVKA